MRSHELSVFFESLHSIELVIVLFQYKIDLAEGATTDHLKDLEVLLEIPDAECDCCFDCLDFLELHLDIDR